MLTSLTNYLFDSRYRKARLWVAFILYSAIIGIGSIPGARTEMGHFAPGLILHGSAYAVITLLLFAGMDGSRLKKSIAALLTVALMGALDEYVQSFLPYRTAAIGDWLIDCSASLIILLLLEVMYRYRSGKS